MCISLNSRNYNQAKGTIRKMEITTTGKTDYVHNLHKKDTLIHGQKNPMGVPHAFGHGETWTSHWLNLAESHYFTGVVKNINDNNDDYNNDYYYYHHHHDNNNSSSSSSSTCCCCLPLLLLLLLLLLSL